MTRRGSKSLHNFWIEDMLWAAALLKARQVGTTVTAVVAAALRSFVDDDDDDGEAAA